MENCSHENVWVNIPLELYGELEFLVAEVIQGEVKLLDLYYWWEAKKHGIGNTMSYTCLDCKDHSPLYSPYTEAPELILQKFELVRKAFEDLEPCTHEHIRRIYISEHIEYSVEINDEEEIDDINRYNQTEQEKLEIVCDDCRIEVHYKYYEDAPAHVKKMVDEAFKRIHYLR